MTKYQKVFILITVFLSLPSIYIIFRAIMGNSIFNSFFLTIIIVILIHWFLFFLRIMSDNKLKWVIYLPAILFGLFTLFLGIIVLINSRSSGCDPSDPGCMNEDYSFVFAVIAFVITILSFTYSFLFKFFWFKNETLK